MEHAIIWTNIYISEVFQLLSWGNFTGNARFNSTNAYFIVNCTFTNFSDISMTYIFFHGRFIQTLMC